MSKESYIREFLPDNLKHGQNFTVKVGLDPKIFRAVATIVASSPFSMSVQSFVNYILLEHLGANEEDIEELVLDAFHDLSIEAV